MLQINEVILIDPTAEAYIDIERIHLVDLRLLPNVVVQVCVNLSDCHRGRMELGMRISKPGDRRMLWYYLTPRLEVGPPANVPFAIRLTDLCCDPSTALRDASYHWGKEIVDTVTLRRRLSTLFISVRIDGRTYQGKESPIQAWRNLFYW